MAKWPRRSLCLGSSPSPSPTNPASGPSANLTCDCPGKLLLPVPGLRQSKMPMGDRRRMCPQITQGTQMRKILPREGVVSSL